MTQLNNRLEREILQYIHENNGSASIPEIVDWIIENGLTDTDNRSRVIDRVNYRFRRLHQDGLLEKEFGEPNVEGQSPPKIAILTEKAETEIEERGLLDTTQTDEDVSYKSYNEIQNEVEQIRNELNALRETIQENEEIQNNQHVRIENLDERIEKLEQLIENKISFRFEKIDEELSALFEESDKNRDEI